MSMFSKLFELLPDAENLLSLQPEELAGPPFNIFRGSPANRPRRSHCIQEYETGD